jgi:NAD(P)-dependent dehydrogenase (short-subunit alcohol dehydrogenase family)
MREFRGKTAFVTGAASGIGHALARAFGREGMKIVLADIEQAAVESAAAGLTEEGIDAFGVVCDVADRSSVRSAAREAIAKYGKVHVVCNNAGVAVDGAIGTLHERDWDWILDVNLKGVVHGVETFVPLIRGHGEGGHIINTASVAGFVSHPGVEAYAATKHAIVAMSEGWAGQLASDGIGVSLLCPHFVRTRIPDSERTRQARYDAGRGQPEPDEGRERAALGVMTGLDPDIVAARAIEGIRAGEFYIFTHPNAREVVERYFKTVLAAFDAADDSAVLKSVREWAPFLPPPAER